MLSPASRVPIVGPRSVGPWSCTPACQEAQTGCGGHPWVAPRPGQSHNHEGAELLASRPPVSISCLQTGWLGVCEA